MTRGNVRASMTPARHTRIRDSDYELVRLYVSVLRKKFTVPHGTVWPEGVEVLPYTSWPVGILQEVTLTLEARNLANRLAEKLFLHASECEPPVHFNTPKGWHEVEELLANAELYMATYRKQVEGDNLMTA